MFSGNSPKFSQLLMTDNVTAILITVCDPATNLTSFITVPSGVQIDLSQLQTDFCQVKFDKLEEEFMEEIMAVINKYMDNSTEMDWSTLNSQYMRLASWVEYWSVNTPILDLPSLANLQTTLEQQYSQELMDWAWASMFGQTLGPITDPDLEKAIATVNLIVKVVNHRLDHLTDTVSLKTLLKNETDLEEVLQAYLNIMQYSTNLLSPDSDINVERLLQLIENGSVLMSMCQSSSLATYLSKTGQATNLTNNIQIAMCVNPEVFMQNIQSQAEADYIEAELMRIWNSSEPLNMNWNDLNSNIENMTRLLTALLQQEPMVDTGLLSLFGNFSMMLQSIEYVLQDPMKLIEMSSSVNPLMSTTVDSELGPFLDVWRHIYSNMHQMISSVQDGKPVNSSLVQNLFNAVSSLDLQSLTGDSNYELLLEEVGQHTDVLAFVCDESAISGHLPGEATAIRGALCGYPANMWQDRLHVVFGMNSTMLAQLVEVLKTVFPQHFMKTPTMTWGEFFDQIQNLTEATVSLNANHTEVLMQAILGALGEMTQSDQTVSSSLEWLKTFTDGTSGGAQGILTFLTEINKYLDRQLQLLKDDGSNVPLSVLLPNSTLLADLLEQLNHETAAGLLAAYINPNEFLELVLTDRWTEVVCNVSLFQSTFMFPNGTNTQRIQQDLCADAQSQESVINDILQRLNMMEVLTAFDDWIMGRAPAVSMNDTYVWGAIQQHTQMLLNNIEKITNLTFSTNGLEQWLVPIMKAVEAMSTPNPESLGQTCEMMLSYIDNTDLYTSSIQPVLLGILSNMAISTKQMAIQSIIEDSLCDLANWNVSALTRRIQETNLTQLIISLGSPVMDVSGTFQCSAMVAASNDIARMWNESVSRMAASNTSFECLIGSLQAPFKLFSDASQTFVLVSDLFGLLTDPAILSLDDTGNILPLMQYMYNVFIQQQNVSVTLVDILTSEASFEEYLQNVLQISPQVMAQLLNSTLSADGLALLNQSAADIAKTLCDPDELSQVLTLPQFANITVEELSNLLCGPDVTSTAEVFKSLMDISTISLLLSEGISDLSQWSVLSAHITDVLNNIQQLTTLPSIDIDLNNLNTLLPYLQRFIYDYGPEALADSLNVLIEDFKSLSNDTMTVQLMADVQHVVKGLTSLKVIRNFIPLNVVLQDVLKHPNSFRSYMIADLGLSPEVTEALLTGAIDYTVLLQYKYTELEEQVCDPSLLSGILNLTTSSVKMSQISTALCNLNDAQIVNLTESLLQNLDIGDLVEQYLISGVGGLLNAINVTSAEVADSLTKLSAAEEDLTAAAAIYKNGSKDLNLNIFSSPEALTGSSLPSLSGVLCGDSSGSLSLSDSIGISGKVGSSQDLSDDQQKEKKQLSVATGQSDSEGFCQEMYVQIATSKYGPVIWTYLKPLMRGKILYSPNTPTTQQLAQMMYNSSFGVLDDVQYYGRLWAKGLTDLNQLKSDPNLMTNINSMASNSLVKGMLQSVTGMSADDLVSGLGLLDNFDQDDLTSMEYLSHLLINYTSCLEMNRFQGYDTESDVMRAAYDYGATNNLLAVVAFDHLEDNSRKKRATTYQLPKHVSYKLRMDIENVRNTVRLKERMWRPYPEDNMVFDMRYTRGFIQLQDMVDSAIIRMQTGQSPNDPVVHVKQFPAPCHVNDTYMNTLSMYLLPIMMTLAWVAALAVSTKNLVYDRQYGQEEALKVMGLYGYLNWWMWFLSSIVIMSLTAVICIVVLKAGSLYIYSSFGILFLYFLIFCFSSLMLCYMVSALFTQATLAVLTVLMVYCASYIPYIVLISMEVQMKFWQKILACLSSTTSFGFAAQYIARYEIQLVGMHWDLIYTSPMPGDDMSFAWCCLMMLIDGVVYLIIGWYLRTIRPGKHGVSQPWYFPVSPGYWGCRSSSPSSKYIAQHQEGLVQTMPSSMTVGMSVQGLSKNYGKTKAVKDLTADFYEGQITVLLGHNGAAKTTTIKMMTGVLEPTHGEIYMYGQPINKCDKKIGICSQHNTLFHYMTVEEHMKFYGSVKSSMSSKDLKYEREQLLRQVDMWHVRNVRVSELSGGMQRRLCVALAFVGGSEVVILDEPTSGVDPNGRHSIWNLILHRKSGCTILLSTHHLDEADMIGDRIAVMDNGRLMCVGSPLFLKQQLGSGYHLKLTKLDECNWVHVLDCVRTYIPEAAVVEDIGSEMTIKLPMTAGNMERLYSCLHNLDQHKDSLHVGSYGIFDTTLEEVFLKICAVAEKNIPLTGEVVQKASEIELSNSQLGISTDRDWQTAPEKRSKSAVKKSRIRVSTGSQKVQQIGALFTKRFHHYRRNWRMFLSVILFPVLFVAAALGMSLIKPNEIESPSLLLTPALYGPNSYSFYSDSAQTVQSRRISGHLWSQPGMSTTCMAGMNFGSQFVCEKGETMFSGSLSSQTAYDAAQCTCSDYSYTCNSHAHSISVPQVVTNTTDIIQNIGAHDVTDYLLKTYETYKENRFGGFSFDAASDGTTNMKATVWFNNKGHHALPGYINALSNSILRSKITQGDPAEYGITTYNHPILLSKQQLDQDSLLQNAADIGVAMVFLLAFTAIPVGFVTYVVNEYTNKEKQLQNVSGVGNFLYWITSLLWDLVVFSFTVGLVIIVMAIFRQNSYWARENLAGVVVLLVMYGWATIPWMYCTVKLYKDSTSAYMVLFCLNVFIGILLVSFVFILNFFSSQEGIKNVYDVVRHVFLIFPPYTLCDGLIQLTTNQIQTEILARFGQDTYVSPFSYDLLAYNYIALAGTGFFFFVILFFTEIRCPSRARVKNSIDDEVEESNEVRIEKQRVLSHQARDDTLVVSSLSKAYKRGRKSFLAVNHLSFGVPKGECFGLLGANGAGKTTTFRMLTGDILPSEGSATINHKRVTRANQAIGQEAGYCPQEEALDGYLTGRELLHCHAKLRGMPAECRDSVVEDLVTRLGLDFVDRTVHTYSGGMKRKLSIAIALLGEPDVVFLDEPTTGMDPVAKRLVWNCLMTCVKNEQAVILTSHSMEECDALCTRLAIMVNGEFRCLGSPQNLKNKYGDGYTVKLFTNGLSTNRLALSAFTQSSFPGSIIRDQHHGILQLDIPRTNLSVANILERLEAAKDTYSITHYSVSQTTLDNVFMGFAREQNDGLSPEFTDCYSGSSDSDSVVTTEPFVSPGFNNFAYSNSGFDGSKSDVLQLPREPAGKFLPQVTIYPDLSTKL
ncbi:ATP-binding cassette sub-family A member 1-like isoform X2 [Mizuhopecten yessoensis]|uniref:ATP-binding cassette sub-family A member 1-like isoform X2 n=1 Tax=Mizuhopecten yessoensis TaxID=6573 RepID=UPI000B458EC3|nr:ATP-binding cassette sub-family A member 1-like isoform X2 [Mizuhopecten yessoensis]